jgi:hypothetical protein
MHVLNEKAPPSMTSIRIDGERLWSSLMTLADIGGTARGGCNRQALTDEDKAGARTSGAWSLWMKQETCSHPGVAGMIRCLPF